MVCTEHLSVILNCLFVEETKTAIERAFYKLHIWGKPRFDIEYQNLMHFEIPADKAEKSKHAEGPVLHQTEKSKTIVGTLIATYFDDVLLVLQALKQTLQTNIQQQEATFEDLNMKLSEFQRSTEMGKDFVE